MPAPEDVVEWRLTFLLTVVALCYTVTGCASRTSARPTPAGAAPAQGNGSVTSESDHKRLAALAAERRGEKGTSGGYRIGPDDLLEVRIPDLLEMPTSATAGTGARPGDAAPTAVSGAPTFAQGVRVSANGDVTLPYLGQVRADGLAPADLEHEIAARLVARGILKHPQVSVNVVEYRSRVVAVVGAVERPGVFPTARPGATVSDLVWAAGGPSKDAGRIVEFTPVESESHDGRLEARTPIRMDLVDILQPKGDAAVAALLPVRPGDVISVSPAGNVTVQGWVDKPGAYPVTRGLSLTGAVAAAGGPSFPADRQHAVLRHALDAGGEQRITADLDAIARGAAPDISVCDGDVIEVPSSKAKLIPWGAWAAIKEVFRVGGTVAVF
jgi:polysaccharide export outer membrane protein